jgi:hypothetical protein
MTFRMSLYVLCAVVLAGVGATPAAAITGLERTFAASSYDDNPTKAAIARCKPGKVVVGGGGVVYEDIEAKTIRLTSLIPRKRDYYAIAEAPNLNPNHKWGIQAHALCVDEDSIDGHQVKYESIDVAPSGGPFVHTAARCPAGTKAYSSGGEILAFDGDGVANGQIGLQLVRTSGPQDIGRVAAREDANGYGGRWRLTAAAVCAEPAGSVHVEGTVSQTDKATHTCAQGKLLGPGGGGGLTDGGPVWLQRILPLSDLRTVDVRLTGPLHPSIGGMVAHAVCGFAF